MDGLGLKRISKTVAMTKSCGHDTHFSCQPNRHRLGRGTHANGSRFELIFSRGRACMVIARIGSATPLDNAPIAHHCILRLCQLLFGTPLETIGPRFTPKSEGHIFRFALV
jgi:hypothetical protein